MKIKRGSTSVRRLIFIADSSSTTGAGLANLTYNSSGLVAYYFAGDLSNEVQITLATATLGTYTSGGFIAVDNTNMPGWYEIGIPDAALDGGNECVIQLRGATNMVPVNLYIELDAVDYQVARFGASDGTGVTLAANQDVRNVSGALPAVTLAASQPNYAPLTTLGTNAPAGWLNAAAFASGSLSGKGDWSTADALSTVSSTLQSMITALNNLSAKANWFGSALLEIPDSGTRAYVFELVIKDDEDKLVNLDGLPTITLTNSAGTDRSSLITTGIANAATGRYTLTITVGTSTTNEALLLKATGTISGETRYAVLATQVVDYDSGAMINTIYTRLGVPTVTLADDLRGVKTVADTIAADTTTLKSRITANLFSGITYMKNWLALIMGKAADNTTKVEVNATTAGATYDQTTDSLEAQQEAGGGGGGGDATAANQTTIINHLNDIKGAGWSSTTDTLEKIRDAITAALDSVIASVGVAPGALTGWPETMSIGDSYTDDCSRSVHLLVRDASDDPITAIGSHAFTDADFTATVVLSQGAQRGRVIGTATWEVGPEGYLNVQIPSKASRRAAEGTATVQVLLRWTNSGDQYTLPATTTRWIAQL